MERLFIPLFLFYTFRGTLLSITIQLSFVLIYEELSYGGFKMYQKESHMRTLIKAISWRVIASLTTTILVYLFFGRLDLAATVGILETLVKIFLYYIHDRVWNKIPFGIKKVEPFVIWMTGLPLSGKTTIARELKKILEKEGIKIYHIDSSYIRNLIPEIGYERKDRIIHLKRIAYLAKILQDNNISTIASFVSPYKETREFIKKLCKNVLIAYIKADIETCKERDYKGVYKKAIEGKIKNFTGISDVYEEPLDADIVIDTRKMSPKEAALEIYKKIKDLFVK